MDEEKKTEGQMMQENKNQIARRHWIRSRGSSPEDLSRVSTVVLEQTKVWRRQNKQRTSVGGESGHIGRVSAAGGNKECYKRGNLRPEFNRPPRFASASRPLVEFGLGTGERNVDDVSLRFGPRLLSP